MRHILLRDLKIPFILTIILMGGLFIIWSGRNTLEIFPYALFIQLCSSFIIVVFGVILNEQYEDIHNGYLFYAVLPCQKLEITGIKFLMPVIMVIFLGLVNRGIYSVFPVPQQHLKMSDSITMVFSIFLVLTCAGIFILIYKLGYSGFIKFTSAFITFGILAIIILVKSINIEMATVLKLWYRLEAWLISGNHLKTLIGGSLLYFILFLLASRIEKK